MTIEEQYMERFFNYLDEWNRLNAEQNKWRFPFYRFIMEMWILHKKHKLTHEYSTYLNNFNKK